MKIKWVFVAVTLISLIALGITFCTSKNIASLIAWGMLGIINVLFAIFLQGENRWK